MPWIPQFSTSSAWRAYQGAMSGGGYLQVLSIADDGTIVVAYDGNNCYIKTPNATQWENLFHQDRMPTGSDQAIWGQGNGGGGGGNAGCSAPTIAIAPSNSDYVYVVSLHRIGEIQAGRVWRRESSAANWRWIATDCYVGISTMTPRGMGPTMKVDPSNPMHVLVSDDAGVIYRTTDGFATFTCLNASGQPLAGILSTATTTGATATGATTLTFGSGTIPAVASSIPSGYGCWMACLNDNTAIKSSLPVYSTTSTQVVSSGQVAGGGIEVGDTIAFGGRACIAFDKSSSVVGGITQGVYIAWSYGAGAVYHSTDGCASFSSISGPTKSLFLTCSDDGVVYLVQYPGTSYDDTPPYRYQSSAWTNLGHTAADGNCFVCVAADPNNAGRVAFIMAAGNIRCSPDYGDNVGTEGSLGYDANYNIVAFPRTDTQCPAMGGYVIPDGVNVTGTIENSMSHGQAMFDPMVANSGRLWIAEGIGCWYCVPETSGTNNVYEMTGFNKNQQSIILNQLIKAPSGNLIGVSQDRAGYRFLDPQVEPTGNFGVHTGPFDPLIHGWGIDHAKNNKNFLVMAATGRIYKSTDEGLLWTLVSSDYGFQTVVACQTSNNFILVPVAGDPVYTTNGGTSFATCSFGGGSITSGWAGYFWNRHMICADTVNSSIYYMYNITNGANGGLWRSTDSGATFTRMCEPISNPDNGAVTMTSGATDFMLTAVPGKEGHLLIGPGANYNNDFPAMWSGDSGATWYKLPGTGVTWLACAGKESPGAVYPAIYTAGRNTADADPTDPGIFVTTNFNPASPSATLTWTRICRAPGGNMDNPKNMVADPDTFGRWYMSTGGTGYVYGYYGASI